MIQIFMYTYTGKNLCFDLCKNYFSNFMNATFNILLQKSLVMLRLSRQQQLDFSKELGDIVVLPDGFRGIGFNS